MSMIVYEYITSYQNNLFGPYQFFVTEVRITWKKRGKSHENINSDIQYL